MIRGPALFKSTLFEGQLLWGSTNEFWANSPNAMALQFVWKKLKYVFRKIPNLQILLVSSRVFFPLIFLGVRGKNTWFPWGQRQTRNHLSEETMEKRSAYYYLKRKSLPASENHTIAPRTPVFRKTRTLPYRKSRTFYMTHWTRVSSGKALEHKKAKACSKSSSFLWNLVYIVQTSKKEEVLPNIKIISTVRFT